MRLKSLLLALILCLSFTPLAEAGGRRGIQPPPRQFEPTDQADLTGKSELLFRWGSEGDRSLIQEYQFKLYKGSQTVESGLIHSVTVPARQDRLTLPAEMFESGGTYAWQLRGSGSAKTRPAYTVFTVKK